jgi:hypothetical protein
MATAAGAMIVTMIGPGNLTEAAGTVSGSRTETPHAGTAATGAMAKGTTAINSSSSSRSMQTGGAHHPLVLGSSNATASEFLCLARCTCVQQRPLTCNSMSHVPAWQVLVCCLQAHEAQGKPASTCLCRLVLAMQHLQAAFDTLWWSLPCCCVVPAGSRASTLSPPMTLEAHSGTTYAQTA